MKTYLRLERAAWGLGKFSQIIATQSLWLLSCNLPPWLAVALVLPARLLNAYRTCWLS